MLRQRRTKAVENERRSRKIEDEKKTYVFIALGANRMVAFALPISSRAKYSDSRLALPSKCLLQLTILFDRTKAQSCLVCFAGLHINDHIKKNYYGIDITMGWLASPMGNVSGLQSTFLRAYEYSTVLMRGVRTHAWFLRGLPHLLPLFP